MGQISNETSGCHTHVCMYIHIYIYMYVCISIHNSTEMVIVNIVICLPPGILMLPQQIMMLAATRMIFPPILALFEREVKLPTIWTHGAAEVGGVREEKE